MTNDELEDADLARAKVTLLVALNRKDAAEIVNAVDELVDVKLAIMLELMADRVEDATGVRP